MALLLATLAQPAPCQCSGPALPEQGASARSVVPTQHGTAVVLLGVPGGRHRAWGRVSFTTFYSGRFYRFLHFYSRHSVTGRVQNRQ